MEIHAFNKIQERVSKVIEFKEKFHLYFDKESCYEKYSPQLVCYDEKGKKSLTREEVEKLTGASFEDAIYLTALMDSTIAYATYDSRKQSVEDYLKENLPLALFSAEVVANQCVKKQRKDQVSIFSFDQVSEKLLDRLVELEAQGVQGLHVTRDMQRKMEQIMKSPEFLVLLNKELLKQNMSIVSGDFIDKDGHFSFKEHSSKRLRVNIRERTK